MLNSRIYNTFLGLVQSYTSGTMHVNFMEKATSTLETILSTLQPPDEAKQLAEAVDTETGQVVKKRKVKAQKDAAEIFNLMEKTWKGFKFLSPRKQFQIRYAKVSTF